jgi:hypothetical protein
MSEYVRFDRYYVRIFMTIHVVALPVSLILETCVSHPASHNVLFHWIEFDVQLGLYLLWSPIREQGFVHTVGTLLDGEVFEVGPSLQLNQQRFVIFERRFCCPFNCTSFGAFEAQVEYRTPIGFDIELVMELQIPQLNHFSVNVLAGNL